MNPRCWSLVAEISAGASGIAPDSIPVIIGFDTTAVAVGWLPTSVAWRGGAAG
jgi:hypothetical protein